MENKLEQLLNSLIKRGRVPFGESRIDKINRAEQYVGNWNWCCRGRKNAIQKRKSTRQLVSKESGIWQFVCENKLVEYGVYTKAKWQRRKEYDNYWNKDIPVDKPEYRLIESSLKDESELEDFLLNSIKID